MTNAGHAAVASALAVLVAINPVTVLAQDGHDHTRTEGSRQSSSPTQDRDANQSTPDSGAAETGDMGVGNGMGMMGKAQMPAKSQMMRDMHARMMGGEMMMLPKGDTGPASLAFHGIAARMHKDLDISYTGQTDVDFAKSMIPHHQAAIDMAKTEIAFGKDPDIKKAAEDIVKTQEAEVAFLQRWLRDRGSR